MSPVEPFAGTDHAKALYVGRLTKKLAGVGEGVMDARSEFWVIFPTTFAYVRPLRMMGMSTD